jgi:hypothetical protein
MWAVGRQLSLGDSLGGREVHVETIAELAEALERLLKHGDGASMLVVTVATTSDGMICTLDEGSISLNFLSAGWLSRANRLFKRFGRGLGGEVSSAKWGKNNVLRLRLGSDPKSAVSLIDQCFDKVWGHRGPYKLDVRGFGWKDTQNLSSQAGT